MRTNSAKHKMLNGQAVFGYSLGLASPLAAEIVAGSGIDFVLIDTQHGSFGPDSVVATLVALAASPATPMARVARNDYTLIGRLLDDGVLGIVVPMVHTEEDAAHAASACRFPPRGQRSWGWGRARQYGDDYGQAVDDELFVAVQIESARAVENAEAILAVPGIDGCWIGPADLALSMGIHPRHGADDDCVARAVAAVITACNNTGKIAGFAANSPAEALRLAAAGCRFLTAGSESRMLLEAARAGVATLGL